MGGFPDDSWFYAVILFNDNKKKTIIYNDLIKHITEEYSEEPFGKQIDESWIDQNLNVSF